MDMNNSVMEGEGLVIPSQSVHRLQHLLTSAIFNLQVSLQFLVEVTTPVQSPKLTLFQVALFHVGVKATTVNWVMGRLMSENHHILLGMTSTVVLE